MLLLPCLFLLAANAPAQCGQQWLPGSNFRSISGQVLALTSLANGDLVAGGGFYVADASATSSIARWNGTEWLPLGSGVAGLASNPLGQVECLATLPNGNLVAAGLFQLAGGMPAMNIAEWDGTHWSPLGGGLLGWVYSMIVMPNGDLIAAGDFQMAGSTTVNNIARWDGSTWSALGSGLAAPPVFGIFGLDLAANGDLYAAGSFAFGGGLAKYDGSSWSVVSAATPSTRVYDLAFLPNGDLAVATPAGIYVWDGSTFTQLGAVGSGRIKLAVDASGTLLSANGIASFSPDGLLHWNGSAWLPVGSAPARNVHAMYVRPNGRLVVGGANVPGGIQVLTSPDNVQEWDGSNWQVLGLDNPGTRPECLLATRNGDVVIGGEFEQLLGTPAANIARWNGNQYVALGSGTNGSVESLLETANGDLIARGSFSMAGGVAANNIARWDGTTWSALGAGLSLQNSSLTEADNGDIIALTTIDCARWDGSSWSLMPSLAGLVFPSRLATTADGTIVVAGTAVAGGANVVFWDGAAWQPLGNFPASCRALLALPNGDLFAAGSNLVSRWDGLAWVALPQVGINFVRALAALPNGNLLALNGDQVLRREAAAWVPFATVSNFNSASASTSAIAVSQRGDVFLSGLFQKVDNQLSAYFAHGVADCPAATVTFGSGCVGSAGPVNLHADNLPWLGSTFRGTLETVPANSLAVLAIGSNPLAVPLPLGAPGCGLYVDPLLVEVLPIGMATTPVAVALPSVPSLAGLVLRAQGVVLELGTLGEITALTSSNALQLVLGSL